MHFLPPKGGGAILLITLAIRYFAIIANERGTNPQLAGFSTQSLSVSLINHSTTHTLVIVIKIIIIIIVIIIIITKIIIIIITLKISKILKRAL